MFSATSSSNNLSHVALAVLTGWHPGCEQEFLHVRWEVKADQPSLCGTDLSKAYISERPRNLVMGRLLAQTM